MADGERIAGTSKTIVTSPTGGASATDRPAAKEPATRTIADRHPGIAGQRDGRAGRQGEAVAPGVQERRVGQLAGDLLGQVAEGAQVARLEMDRVQVWDPDPIPQHPAFALHHPLDPMLDLDRLDVSPEQARGGSFEEALEQALEAR